LDREIINFLKEFKKDVSNEFKTINNKLNNLEKDVNDLKSDVSILKGDVNDLKSDVSILKEDVNTLKVGQNEIKNLVTDIDPRNANRHIEITNMIDDLRRDLSTVEVVTANNYANIAKLKSIK
jgi:archaellum component FlaC